MNNIDLQTPVLYKDSVMIIDDDYRNVTIQWEETDEAMDNVVYVLSVNISSSSEVTYFTTTQLSKTLKLQVGINYSISLIAQQCDGALTSNTSNVLHIFFDSEGKAKGCILYYYYYYY